MTQAQKWLIAHCSVGVSAQPTLSKTLKILRWTANRKNKNIGNGAQRRTYACKLFRSRFQMVCKTFSMRITANCFHWI